MREPDLPQRRELTTFEIRKRADLKVWLRNPSGTEVAKLHQKQWEQVSGSTPPPLPAAIQDEEPYVHLWYWAAFMLIGDPY
jgi:hypothetical protein